MILAGIYIICSPILADKPEWRDGKELIWLCRRKRSSTLLSQEKWWLDWCNCSSPSGFWSAFWSCQQSWIDGRQCLEGRESPSEQWTALEESTSRWMGGYARLAPGDERTKIALPERQGYPLSPNSLFEKIADHPAPLYWDALIQWRSLLYCYASPTEITLNSENDSLLCLSLNKL